MSHLMKYDGDDPNYYFQDLETVMILPSQFDGQHIDESNFKDFFMTLSSSAQLTYDASDDPERLSYLTIRTQVRPNVDFSH